MLIRKFTATFGSYSSSGFIRPAERSASPRIQGGERLGISGGRRDQPPPGGPEATLCASSACSSGNSSRVDGALRVRRHATPALLHDSSMLDRPEAPQSNRLRELRIAYEMAYRRARTTEWQRLTD